jgi:serine/threonine protein kinase
VEDFWTPVRAGASGERWFIDWRTNVPETPARGRFHYGWAEAKPDERVWLQRITLRDERDEEDWEHLFHAAEMARVPAISSSPFIRRVLDTIEWEDDRYLVSEYAEHRLPAIVRGATSGPRTDDVVQNIAAALDAIHDAGYIHGDVHPENVLCVRGVWKLADLGSATRAGHPLTTRPPAKYSSFFPADIEPGSRADRTVDSHALLELARYVRGEWHAERASE